MTPDPRGQAFFKAVGGRVFVFDLASGRTVGPSLDVRYRPDALAFRPGHRDQIATAGGNNHEVRLWRLNGSRSRAAPWMPGSASALAPSPPNFWEAAVVDPTPWPSGWSTIESTPELTSCRCTGRVEPWPNGSAPGCR